MAALFVTAAGTGLGKTFVMVHLIRALAARGLHALKPVASGFDISAAAQSDTGLILEALGLSASAANLDAVSPWRFQAPLSPDMAAAREGRTIDFDELAGFCAGAAQRQPTLVEGVGGVMSPVAARHTVVDLIAAMGCPSILVAGSYLGAVSHTLTAVECLRGRGRELAAVVASESAGSSVPLDDTAASLRRFLGATPLVVVPRAADAHPAALAPLTALAERLLL
jgi:dethiobiotin synthetase